MSDLFAGLKSSKISIIVPVFNEAKRLESNLKLLINEVEPFFDDYEIIVVSDGSTDETNRILKSVQIPRLTSIILDKNQGKGNAVRQGFSKANGDFILFIDGGMELHPKEIRTFVGLQRLYEADIVLGSKRHPQSEIDYPKIRRFLSSIYQMIVHYFFDIDVTDTQVGFKLFRKPVIQAVLPNLSIDRYGFDLELLALAKLKGFGKMLEAPIKLDYFTMNSRPAHVEVFHIFKVGYQVFADAVRVYFKLRRLKREQR